MLRVACVVQCKHVRLRPLECQTLITIGNVNDSAVFEAVLLEQVLHYGVVAEGVDAYVATDAEAVVERSGECAVSVGQACDAVNYIIRQVVEPCSVVDFGVGRVGARLKGERTYGLVASQEKIAGVGCDVCHDDIFARIAVFPLSGVATVVHNLYSRLHQFHDYWQIGFGGVAYC